MNIFVHNRSFFENWRGKKMERQLFQNNRIISINSVSSPAEQPPFSQEFLEADNLLVLYFDDVNEEEANAMTPEQAKQIVDFIHTDDNRPIMVHCTAGVSRSGAVGQVLNWYFNRYITENQPDYHLNESMNSGCAVIACDAIGSVPFLLKDGENGFSYPLGDFELFYARLKALLDSRELSERLGKQAYLTMTSLWNAKTAAQRLLKIASGLIENGELISEDDGPCSIAEIRG